MDTPPPPPIPQPPQNPVPPPVPAPAAQPPAMPPAVPLSGTPPPPVIPYPSSPPPAHAYPAQHPYPSSPPPANPYPAHPYPASPPPGTPAPTPFPGAAATDKLVQAFKQYDWKQLGNDCKTFAGRFSTGDFAHIHPGPGELPVVAGLAPRMASLVVWRRALLFMAAVLSVVLFLKSCFDPHTFRSALEKQTAENLRKLDSKISDADLEKKSAEEVDKTIKVFGESNIVVANALVLGQWGTIIASAVFQILAAIHWREWRRSRKLSLFAVLAMLVPMLMAMVFPWSAIMDFRHLKGELAQLQELAPGVTPEMMEQQVRTGMQGIMALTLLFSALPLFYGLFNGVLRATLTAKTLIPASIVCGWSTLLLALTICVPWFCILTVVSQFQADAIIVLGIICLVAAPLSLVIKSRRLGAPLSPEEATPVVKKARLFFTGLNIVGILMLSAYLLDKKIIDATDLISPVIQYFANLMLITVVGVDQLSLLLERAHMKLASDPQPDEALRQLGEVLYIAPPRATQQAA